ncbi:rhomboid family intramembrane serine protease [Aliiroseovarius sp. PTFE2010]|uniref:rhomboid family intramembrane serine protease n=1 Tax=Aliiroseovarius sp. PTFE2010 TaxID=3417190 RepID=UPI003CEE388C
MPDPAKDEIPFNPLPPMVIALAVVLGAIELVFQAGSAGIIGGQAGIGLRAEAVDAFGFSAPLMDLVADRGAWSAEVLMRFVTYAFVHVSATHVIFVIVFLLALGKMVGETFGNIAVLVIFLAASAVGALAFWLLTGTQARLIGGMPGAYGMIGGYTFMLWVGLGALHQNQMRAFTLIAFLMGIQLLFGLLFGGPPDWVADLAGFATGFVVAALFVPGSGTAMLKRLRRR